MTLGQCMQTPSQLERCALQSTALQCSALRWLGTALNAAVCYCAVEYGGPRAMNFDLDFGGVCVTCRNRLMG